MKWLTLIGCVACGDNLAPTRPTVDAMIDSTAAGCTATFAGNFDEVSTSTASCPTLGSDGTLGFAIASTTIGTVFTIAINLGPAPAPGAYSSETITNWSAMATLRIGNGACEYAAGGSATPMGSFALTLDAGVHGQLMVSQYVLTVPGTNCGDPDTESIAVVF